MPGNENLLSICCLGYRHAPYIEDCIQSIWRDPWPYKEIIAMDDGSDDGSVDILKKLQNQSPCPFTILEQDNSGNVPANFNRLFKASSGNFTLFTSLDDMQMPGALQTRMEFLQKEKNSVFAAHTRCFIRNDGNSLRQEATPLSGKHPDPTLALELERSQLHSFYIQGAIFRRSILEAVNVFSENMLGDDIVLRTKIFFYMKAHPELTFTLIDEPGFIYRRHAGNISANVARQLKLAVQYYDRFWRDQPYPEMLRRWLLRGLNVESWEVILKFFAHNGKAAAFLLDKDIQEGLRLNAVRSYVKEQQQ